jgi:hypothetical protein
MSAIVIDLAAHRRVRRADGPAWLGSAVHAISGIEELLRSGERAAVVRLCAQAIAALDAGRRELGAGHTEVDALARRVEILRRRATT